MGAKSPPPRRLSSPRSPGPTGSTLNLPPLLTNRRFVIRVGAVAAALFLVGLLAWRPGTVPHIRGSSLRATRQGHGGAGTGAGGAEIGAALIVDLEDEFAYTHYDGGLAGYSVFSNLYLAGGVLTAVSPDAASAASIPAPRDVLSGKADNGRPPPGEDRWLQITDLAIAANQLGKRAIRLPGVTYLFNDPPGQAGFLAFYEHFIQEIFVPAAHIVASAAPDADPYDLLPQRIMFARCPADPSWRDDTGKNLWFLQHALPGVVIEDATQWRDREASDIPYVFDKIIIVDRGSAHSALGDTATWGKMNMIVPSIPAPRHFWNPFRESVVESIGDHMPHVGKYNLPVVVYIERKNLPMLSQASHEAIVAGLKRLTKRAEIHVAELRAMTKQQRISLLSRASIVVGLTGDDLMEVMWMPNRQGAMVVELFEAGGFQRDFEAFTSMLNLDYMAIQNDLVLTEKMWRSHGRKRGPQKDGEIDVDGKLVARMVELQLARVR